MSQLVNLLGKFGIGISELNVVNMYNPEVLYAYNAGFNNASITEAKINVRFTSRFLLSYSIIYVLENNILIKIIINIFLSQSFR